MHSSDKDSRLRGAWRTQFEWLMLRGLQLDAQLQPVDYQHLALFWGKYQQASESGQSMPPNLLVEFVSELFEGMGSDDMAWEKEPKLESLPLLAVSHSLGFLLLHARNSDGTWMAEGPEGLKQVAELPAGLSFSGVIGCARRKSRGTAKEMFRATLHEYKTFFVYAALATILMNFLALVTSLYSMQVYDRVIPSQGVDTLFTLTGGVLISIVLETMTKFMRSSIMDQAIERMDLKLSYKIFDRLLRVRMDQFPSSVGTLSGQLRSYEMVRGFVSSVAIYLLVDTPFALLFLIVIFMVGGVWIGLIPLTFFMICLGLGMFFKGRIEAHAKASQAASNRKLGLLVEAVETAEAIKSTGAAWHFQGKWNALTRQNMVEDASMRHISEGSGYYAAALQQISYVMLVGVGAYIASTSTLLTSGALIACSILSGRVLQPVASLPGLMVQWANAKSSMASLEGVFKLEQDNHDVQQALTLEKFRGNLSLRSVAYAYPERPQSLEIRSLEIRAGEKVGVIGAIGGGKTTLLKILSGLYRPQKGRALIDGLDMQHIARGCLSRHIGYLPQQVRLFAGTLRENLTLGLIGVGDEQLRHACEIVGLMPLINGHSKGFDLPITEGGQGVSGGQRQLIGLTRLILARPQVWLLDEPTASMDDATEIRTVQILSQIIQPDQTLILVTHKPAMLALVGRVIVMGSDGIVLDGLRDAVLTALQEKHGKKETSSRQPNPTSSSDEKDQPVKQALSPMTITMGGRKYETT
jgi:ATP-binding cassette, subfamily C, bacterial LapB